MLAYDDLGRLRHHKYVPTVRKINCCICGNGYSTPLRRISQDSLYVCQKDLHTNTMNARQQHDGGVKNV